MSDVDLIVIGGGIVGLSAAWQALQRDPKRSVAVLEKEDRVAAHQTGRNSGVLHSGIYYKPGSLRATNCRTGKLALERFCDQFGVPWKRTGKVIVAIDDSELPALDRILDRGRANGVECQRIDANRLRELEPHAAGIAAIHVPEAGIVDYVAVCEELARQVEVAGNNVHFNRKVTDLRQSTDRVEVVCEDEVYTGRNVVNCTGLFSDRTARLSGQKLRAKIVPFRGEYYELVESAEHLCNGLIYPVPDTRFPFLGVHFTRMIQGGVECGPNAVLALAREGYRWTDVNFRDLFESVTYPGFLRLAARNWRMGIGEVVRSLSKRAFVKALQRLIPEIKSEQLKPSPSGVRAQALARDGNLIDDFLLERQGRVLNVCNAPSPAATAALNIGRLIIERLEE